MRDLSLSFLLGFFLVVCDFHEWIDADGSQLPFEFFQAEASATFWNVNQRRELLDLLFSRKKCRNGKERCLRSQEEEEMKERNSIKGTIKCKSIKKKEEEGYPSESEVSWEEWVHSYQGRPSVVFISEVFVDDCNVLNAAEGFIERVSRSEDIKEIALEVFHSCNGVLGRRPVDFIENFLKRGSQDIIDIFRGKSLLEVISNSLAEVFLPVFERVRRSTGGNYLRSFLSNPEISRTKSMATCSVKMKSGGKKYDCFLKMTNHDGYWISVIFSIPSFLLFSALIL